MFENVISDYTLQIKNQFDLNSSAYELNEIRNNSKINQNIRNFVVSYFKWIIYKDNLEKCAKRYYNLNIFKDLEFFEYIEDYTLQKIRFDNSTLSKIIDEFAYIHFNYLFRPISTLKYKIFSGEPTKILHEILMKWDCLSDYQYLKDSFTKRLIKENRISSNTELITESEFAEILKEIQSDKILNISLHEFLKLIQPILDFYHTVKSSTSIPINILVLYFDDAGLNNIAGFFESLMNEGIESLEKDRILEQINSFLQNKKDYIGIDLKIIEPDEAAVETMYKDFKTEPLENSFSLNNFEQDDFDLSIFEKTLNSDVEIITTENAKIEKSGHDDFSSLDNLINEIENKIDISDLESNNTKNADPEIKKSIQEFNKNLREI